MVKRIISIILLFLLLMSTFAYGESAASRLAEMYSEAELLMVNGDYISAAEKFDILGTYSDSSRMAMYCKAIYSAETLSQFDLAIETFNSLEDFRDSKQMALYYTAREGEYAGDLVLESLEEVSDEELSGGKASYFVAAEGYKELALYKDSMVRASSCMTKSSQIDSEISKRLNAQHEIIYQQALACEEAKDYLKAIDLYVSIEGYKDSSERLQQVRTAYHKNCYETAVEKRDASLWDDAVSFFEKAEDYADAADQILATRYMEGLSKRSSNDWDGAITAFSLAGSYQDAKGQITETTYMHAVWCMENNELVNSCNYFGSIKGYKDADKKKNEALYRAGLKYEELGYYATARNYFILAGDVEDAPEKQLKMLSLYNEEPLYRIKGTNGYGYCNAAGDIVLECKWPNARPFNEWGIAEVIRNNRSGLIDRNGNLILPYDYEIINDLGYGYVEGRKKGEGNFWLYDKTGYEFPESYYWFSLGVDEEGISYYKSGDSVYYYEFKSKKTKKFNVSWCGSNGYHEGLLNCYFSNWDGDPQYVIDKNGRIVIDFRNKDFEGISHAYFSEGLMKVHKKDASSGSDSYGFIDTKGNLVIPCIWGHPGNCSEGLITVSSPEDKFTYIDKTGRRITDGEFEAAWPMKGGRAAVKMNGKWGFIDNTGTIVIDCIFDQVESFQNGFSHVTYQGQDYYIDGEGKFAFSFYENELLENIPLV